MNDDLTPSDVQKLRMEFVHHVDQEHAKWQDRLKKRCATLQALSEQNAPDNMITKQVHLIQIAASHYLSLVNDVEHA